MLEFVLLAAVVFLAAFYSGCETGLYSLNRLRLLAAAERGRPAERALESLLERPRLTLSAMLLGTNISVYAATILCTRQVLRHTALAARADLYSSLIMPPVLLIFAEIIPKCLFQRHADRLMRAVVYPLKLSIVALYPFAQALRWVSAVPYRLIGKRAGAAPPPLTHDVFRFYLGKGAEAGALSAYQRRMAENILRLQSVSVESALVPLEKVVMIPEGASWQELTEKFREHRYSRLPVWRDEPENIVGLVNVIDVACAEAPGAPRSLMREVSVTFRSDTSVADALSRLRQAQQQFAVVVGGDGRAIGILTAKDLVEEIVGELAAW
ncbi:MAG: DUF21 domain-containing protein [Planctomycetes bacterium]|nr:DUF21 domain-containing protein [Planctomycetota bacterium]